MGKHQSGCSNEGLHEHILYADQTPLDRRQDAVHHAGLVFKVAASESLLSAAKT